MSFINININMNTIYINIINTIINIVNHIVRVNRIFKFYFFINNYLKVNIINIIYQY